MSLISGLSRTAWRTSWVSYSSVRHISCSKGILCCSGDVIRAADAHETDNIYESFRAAKSSKTLLEIANQNHKSMDEKQTVEVLKAIFLLQKEGKSTISTENIIRHPGFEKICKNMKKYSGVVSLNDTIDALKIITFLGVPATATIVQVLFQLIRKNINSLNIPQILFVHYLLKSFVSTPLVDALHIALPLVFEINLKMKMNDSNPAHISDCLQYAVYHGLSEESIHFIIRKLEEFQGEFTGETARSIIATICMLPRNSSYKSLIEKASTDLVLDIYNVPFIKVEVLLHRMAHKYSKLCNFYYQEVLFDTCANLIIDRNVGYKRALGILRNMGRVHHVHKSLLDYVSSYLHENPLTEKESADIYSMAISLMLTDYKPVHWEHLKNWIKTSKNLAAENRREIIWIRFAAALCALDIYKIDVLSRALQEDYLRHLFQKSFRSNYENYFFIWQCVTTFKPDLVDLLPSDLSPKDLVGKLLEPEEFPLEGALEQGLGGARFLLSNLFSKLGVQIDHAIVFSQGVPVPLGTKVKFVEDIKLKDESQQLVLIWTGKPHDYTVNTNTLRATVAKSLSIMEETLKCSVIPVNLISWNELEDFEKIPYLMQKIKEKLDLDINVSESAL